MPFSGSPVFRLSQLGQPVKGRPHPLVDFRSPTGPSLRSLPAPRPLGFTRRVPVLPGSGQHHPARTGGGLATRSSLPERSSTLQRLCPKEPVPRVPLRVRPARRRLPPLRPVPARSVSTLAASRQIPGSGRPLGTRPITRSNPSGTKTSSRHKADRTSVPGTPQNRPGLFHPGNAPELSPSGP
jgi:hypothetical protein